MSQYSDGIQAAKRAHDAVRASDYYGALCAYETAIECFEKSTSPNAVRHCAQIGRILIQLMKRGLK